MGQGRGISFATSKEKWFPMISGPTREKINDKYSLTHALSLEISEEDGEWFATSYDLGLVGYGDSENEAVDDFKENLCGYFDFLKSQEDAKLSGSLLIHKGILEKIIK